MATQEPDLKRYIVWKRNGYGNYVPHDYETSDKALQDMSLSDGDVLTKRLDVAVIDDVSR